MNEIVSKAMRLKRPVNISCRIRPEVYACLSSVAKEPSCAVSFLVCGLLEDFYDRCMAEKELSALRDTFPVDQEA